jgi:hypothetical protein
VSALRDERAGSGRRVFRWTVVSIVLIILFVLVWVGARAMMAREELLGAVPIANKIGTEILSDRADLDADLSELQTRASKASALTSDPIWRMAEFTPFLGTNLTAFREAASLIDDLAVEALPPVSTLSETFSLSSLQPQDGVFQLDVFESAQPLLSQARSALKAADESAASIDTASTIPQIGSAVDQVVVLVANAREVVDGLDTAAMLLPSMLGAEEPRNYLLLSLNNAELRATGGLPGAVAVLEADRGKIQLGATSSATALGEFDLPVLQLTDAERTLYGDVLGTYLHDVNYTPDFARSGELARAMWEERTGQPIDGVLSVDPVALGYILEATGPIDAGAGVSLSADNAADVLLRDAYSMFPDPVEQDAFFAGVTGRIFEAVTRGEANSFALLRSLGRAADENRIHVWSARSAEQELLRGTPVEGAVPTSSDESTGFGVYMNDATGAKMDYYLDGAIAIASGVCRDDGRPNFEVRVQLSSSAPLDAAESLPGYVTGAEAYGVAAGNIRTNLFVYAPAGSVPFSVTIDGEEFAFVAADESDHSVAGVTVELEPGQQAVVSMKFVGVAGAADSVILQHTPMAGDVDTALDTYLDCDDVAPAPIDEGEQSGALGADVGRYNWVS